MKCIKKLILMMIPVIFLVGCSTSGMNDKNVSKEAIERNTMTKVQNDVNVIMDKSYDYVLQNMGSPYSTIYSLKIDNINDFKDVNKIKGGQVDDVKVLSTGLLYPKYTSDYKLDGSAIYIGLKNGKVNQVETCDFKNFDVSQLMDEKSNISISSYTNYDNLNMDNIDRDKLNNYIGKEKSSLSDIIKHKKCKYSIYMDLDDPINIDIYDVKDSDFLMIAYKDDIIIDIGEQDCTNILSSIQENID